MLTFLHLDNFILIDQVSLHLHPGLTLITGETGAGKSALLKAMRLIAGERNDENIVGRRRNQAILEAHFIDPKNPTACTILKREFLRGGKNRCFYNQRQVPLNLFKELTQTKLNIVGSTSYWQLKEPAFQLEILDTFAGTEDLVTTCTELYCQQTNIEEQLRQLEAEKTHLQASKTIRQELIALIDLVDWQDQEEAHLEEELVTLSKKLASSQHVEATLHHLEEALAPLQKALVHIVFHAPFQEELRGVSATVQEILYQLRSWEQINDLELARIEEINHRLHQISKIQTKVAHSWAEVQRLKKSWIEELASIESKDGLQQELQEESYQIQQKLQTISQELSIKRHARALELSRRVEQELQQLQLPFARVSITLQQKSVGAKGVDQVIWLFSANRGVPLQPVELCASSGEIARLFLSIYVVTSGLITQETTLFFDEIDSHVGGYSAKALGKVLRRLSLTTQILCITHFIQVAKLAQHHLLVYKTLQDAFETSFIVELSDQEKEIEYQRMVGEVPLPI
jgi:DNA repair protein RecN (Recombination protein N)